MIAHLRGTLIEKHPNQAIVEAGGVGYDVQISVSTFSALPEVGSEVKLRIYTNVREDAIQLFGFREAMEKALFEKLITVSGIGPKLAITTLSGVAAPDLVRPERKGEAALEPDRLRGLGGKPLVISAQGGTALLEQLGLLLAEAAATPRGVE